MIRINLNKLRNLQLRLNHNHSGEYGDYYWKVIDWHENEEYCSKYDYKVQFQSKKSKNLRFTHMFYGVDANSKLLKASINWIIRHYVDQGKRPPKMDLK